MPLNVCTKRDLRVEEHYYTDGKLCWLHTHHNCSFLGVCPSKSPSKEKLLIKLVQLRP